MKLIKKLNSKEIFLFPLWIIVGVLLLLASTLLNLLGRRMAHRIGFWGGDLFYTKGLYRKEIVVQNIAMSSLRENSLEGKKDLERTFFRHFGRVIVDLLRMLVMPNSFIQEDVTMSQEGLQKIEKVYREEDKGIIILTGHVGHWELALGILAHSFPVYALVKSPSIWAARVLLFWRRRKYKIKQLYADRGIKTIRQIDRAIKQKKIICIVLDQHFPGKNKVRVNFLGQPCSVSNVIPRLIQQRNIRVLTGCSFYDEQGKTYFEVLDEQKSWDPDNIPQSMMQTIEKIIRKHPEQWLWTHRLWK